MTCPKCEAQVADNAKTCPECGASLAAGVVAAPSKSKGVEKSEVKKLQMRLEGVEDEDEREQIIRNFILPETKKGLLDFVLLAVSRLDHDRNAYDPCEECWQLKLDEALRRAKFVFADDPDGLNQIKSEVDEMNSRKQKCVDKIKGKRKKSIIIFFSVVAAIVIGIVAYFTVPPAFNAIAGNFVTVPEERVFAENEVAFKGLLGTCFTVPDAVIRSADKGETAVLTMTVKKTFPTSPVIDKVINEKLKEKNWRWNNCKISLWRESFLPDVIEGLYESEVAYEVKDIVESLINMDVGKSMIVTLPIYGKGEDFHGYSKVETGRKAKKFITTVMEMPKFLINIEATYKVENASKKDYMYVYIK